MIQKTWAIGVDLGGTKIETAQVDASGHIGKSLRTSTDPDGSSSAILSGIIRAIEELRSGLIGPPPAGVGVGVAGQIDPRSGAVLFAPNIGWRDVPLGAELIDRLQLPVVVTNDVRAATWGEWIHGAGQNCNDLICLFVGTGVGGGIVCNGQILSGCGNTAGEIGHITIDLQGPSCTCGNRGCLEALAGGWAIARQAREAVSRDPMAGRLMLEMAGGVPDLITARLVAGACQNGDSLARDLIEKAGEALVAGAVSLVNAFNPCRLILGGGVIEGLPEWIDRVARGIRERALPRAASVIEVLPARLKNGAGVVGAATLAMRLFGSEKKTDKEPA